MQTEDWKRMNRRREIINEQIRKEKATDKFLFRCELEDWQAAYQRQFSKRKLNNIMQSALTGFNRSLAVKCTSSGVKKEEASVVPSDMSLLDVRMKADMFETDEWRRAVQFAQGVFDRLAAECNLAREHVKAIGKLISTGNFLLPGLKLNPVSMVLVHTFREELLFRVQSEDVGKLDRARVVEAVELIYFMLHRTKSLSKVHLVHETLTTQTTQALLRLCSLQTTSKPQSLVAKHCLVEDVLCLARATTECRFIELKLEGLKLSKEAFEVLANGI